MGLVLSFGGVIFIHFSGLGSSVCWWRYAFHGTHMPLAEACMLLWWVNGSRGPHGAGLLGGERKHKTHARSIDQISRAVRLYPLLTLMHHLHIYKLLSLAHLTQMWNQRWMSSPMRPMLIYSLGLVFHKIAYQNEA